MTGSRRCEQCGGMFQPRREHARFCSGRCRVAWNRENAVGRAAEVSALDWSVAAMCEANERLLQARVRDQAHAFTVISEAVWWVTIVDATLVRYHAGPYDAVLASWPAARRRNTEGTLGGLRFVRNQMGYHLDPADLIRPPPDRSGAGHRPITTWTWRPVPASALASLPSERQEWELSRYQAYQAHLADQAVGEVFRRAAAFLSLATSRAAAASVSA